jgi:hypothetical protein
MKLQLLFHHYADFFRCRQVALRIFFFPVACLIDAAST